MPRIVQFPSMPDSSPRPGLAQMQENEKRARFLWERSALMLFRAALHRQPGALALLVYLSRNAIIAQILLEQYLKSLFNHSIFPGASGSSLAQAEAVSDRQLHLGDAGIAVKCAATGKISWVNQGFIDFSGLQRYEILGRTSQELWQDKHGETILNHDLQVGKGEILLVSESLSLNGVLHSRLAIRFPLEFDASGMVSTIAVIGFEARLFSRVYRAS